MQRKFALKTPPLLLMPMRMYHPKWLPQYRDIYKPTYFDDVVRRWDWKYLNTKKCKTQDPLFFDHQMTYVNGGIQLMIDQIHDKANYSTNVKNMSFLLYNMVYRDIYDPKLFEKLEGFYKTVEIKHLETRHCYGAVWAYYKSNQGSRFGIDFWEALLEKNLETLHVQEIVSLLEAFRHNRQLHRDHMKEKLNNFYKKIIMDRWKDEVVYAQRVLFDLAHELQQLGWFDKDVWMLIFKTTVEKTRINNTHDFNLILNIMHDVNNGSDDRCKHLKGKVQPFIEQFLKRHYNENVDRKWRYDAENHRWRTLQELIDRREEGGSEDQRNRKADVDESLIIQAREAERRLKRLKMAKYSTELFDEIIAEMMRENRVMMEMMAELDCDEDAIYASQTRIAKKQQTANMIEARLKAKEAKEDAGDNKKEKAPAAAPAKDAQAAPAKGKKGK